MPAHSPLCAHPAPGTLSTQVPCLPLVLKLPQFYIDPLYIRKYLVFFGKFILQSLTDLNIVQENFTYILFDIL
jgi:hypothetical protein